MKKSNLKFLNFDLSIVNWSLLIVLWCTVTFFFFYDDQIVTVGHTIIFWKAILEGNLTGGYQECIEVAYSTIPHLADTPAIYEPMVYLTIGILSFPLIVLNQLGQFDFKSVWFHLYVKLQQILLIWGCSCAIWKISLELECEISKAKRAVVLFASNIGLIYFAIVIGQVEIYTVFFSLWGIYYWIRKDTAKFILFFAFAIPMKMFSLLIFFPLILIRQKNIKKIILYLLGGMSVYLLCKIIWSTNEAYRICTAEPGQRMIDTMKAKQFAGGLGIEGIPTFACLYLIICFFVFICNRDDGKWACYCSFVVYALLFIFVGHYPYWIVILTPFLPILIAEDKKKETINLLADLVFWISYMISALMYHTWITNYSIVDNMFLPELFGHKTVEEVAYVSVGELMRSFHLEKYAVFFAACYVSALIVLIIVNYPKTDNSFATIDLKKDIIDNIRITVIIPILCLMCYCYYIPKPSLLFDTSGNENMDMGYNLFSTEVNDYGEEALVQKIKFNNNAQVNRLKLFFSRTGNTYQARGSLVVKFKDTTENKTLYSKRIGYNELTWGDFTVFDTGNIFVTQDHEYALLISNDYWQYSDLWTHIKITTENVVKEPLEYLGNDVGYDLFMKVEGTWE